MWHTLRASAPHTTNTITANVLTTNDDSDIIDDGRKRESILGITRINTTGQDRWTSHKMVIVVWMSSDKMQKETYKEKDSAETGLRRT